MLMPIRRCSSAYSTFTSSPAVAAAGASGRVPITVVKGKTKGGAAAGSGAASWLSGALGGNRQQVSFVQLAFVSV
jgi:hypothetical protein